MQWLWRGSSLQPLYLETSTCEESYEAGSIYIWTPLVCFMFVFFILSCLFLAALWSPAWNGLTSWLFVWLVCDLNCVLSLSHMVSWVKCGTWLYRFLIFAFFTLSSANSAYSWVLTVCKSIRFVVSVNKISALCNRKWRYCAIHSQGNILSYWAATCDFQQCGILTSVDSDEPVQLPFKLRNSKWCSVSSLTLLEYSSD